MRHLLSVSACGFAHFIISSTFSRIHFRYYDSAMYNSARSETNLDIPLLARQAWEPDSFQIDCLMPMRQTPRCKTKQTFLEVFAIASS